MRSKRRTGRVSVFMICSFLLLLLGFLGSGQAEAVDGVQYVGQINTDKTVLFGPGRLAIGGDGTLYVADGYKNHVLMFGKNGEYKGEITVPKVSAVAVAPNGTLYIGSHKDYSVEIVRNGKVVGYLGSGAREFSSITDIAVDTRNGNVYVVDSKGDSVKVYGASGALVKNIGGLHQPVAITIAGNEIYILDNPVVQDPSTTAAEIKVYDKKGNVVRVFGEAGMDQYKLAHPTGIAVSGGNVYVSDAARKAVLVYTTAGTSIGEIKGSEDILGIAVSLALSRDGVLYVSSSGTKGVQAFAIKSTGTGTGGAGK